MRKLLLALVFLFAVPHVYAAGPCVKSAANPDNTGLVDGAPVPCYEDGHGNVYVLLAGGSATIGKVDQGLPNAGGAASWWFQKSIGGAAESATNGGYFNVLQGNAMLSASNPLFETPVPTTNAGAALTPVVSTSAESNHVICSGACNLYGWLVTNGATPGYVMVFNATSAPSDGAVTPTMCVSVPSANSSVSYNNGTLPSRYSTGVTIVFSTTGCFTKTASATAYIQGRAD